MYSARLIVLIVTTVLTGLLAGFFYAWSCSVMAGLKTTEDRTFIEAMQRINIAILNPIFALGFFGPLVGLPLSVVMLLSSDDGGAWMSALLALIAYLSVILITMLKNQPMNLALDAAGEFAAMDDPHAVRTRFESPWVRWNHLRTVNSILTFVFIIIAVVEYAAG
jgi:uncharacterized membrane protein